jgi:hypothetical protein
MSELAARFVKPVLYVQAVLLTVLAIVLFFAHAVPLTQSEPILATRVGDLYLGEAVILLIAAARYTRDKRWLLIPLLFALAEFLNSLVQLVIQLSGVKLPTDPMLLPPLVIDLVFLVYYAVAYRGLPAPD